MRPQPHLPRLRLRLLGLPQPCAPQAHPATIPHPRHQRLLQQRLCHHIDRRIRRIPSIQRRSTPTIRTRTARTRQPHQPPTTLSPKRQPVPPRPLEPYTILPLVLRWRRRRLQSLLRYNRQLKPLESVIPRSLSSFRSARSRLWRLLGSSQSQRPQSRLQASPSRQQ